MSIYQRENKIYYYYRYVEYDIRPYIPHPHTNKENIRISLKTKDELDAKVLARKLDAMYDELTNRIREGNVGISPTVSYLNGLTQPLQQPQFQQQQLIPLANPAPVVEKPTNTIKKMYEEYINNSGTEQEYKNLTKSCWDILLEISDLSWNSSTERLSLATFVEWKSKIRSFPTYRNKSDFKDLSVKQLIKLVEDNPGKYTTMSSQSINKHLTVFSATMEFGTNHGYIKDNYAKGLKVVVKDRKERQPYDKDDINKIFNHPKFREDKSQWDHHQWLPIIALFHGARMEEISQLLMEDIKSTDQIMYFRITNLDDEGDSTKKVKTATSKRDVPVHPALIEMGFMDYIARIAATDSKRLFPLMKFLPAGNKWSHYYSRWWGNQRETFGIKSSTKVFHSFRHTFKSVARGVMADEWHNAICGHSGNSVGDKYGVYYIKDKLEKISLVKFDLPAHLYK